jgi:hypothetical protein
MSTTNNRSNWRQRMVEKERREREAVAAAAEQERLKHTVLNETNFPSHLVSTAHPLTYRLPLNGFASRAAEAEEKDTRQKLIQEHKRHRARMDRMTSDVFNAGLHRVHTSRRHRIDYGDDEDEIEVQVNKGLSEMYPRHRGRHFSTEPDAEGWREVIRYTRKKRVLTDAELERKARAEILGEDSEEDEDLNGDLTDRNQRRDFY